MFKSTYFKMSNLFNEEIALAYICQQSYEDIVYSMFCKFDVPDVQSFKTLITNERHITECVICAIDMLFGIKRQFPEFVKLLADADASNTPRGSISLKDNQLLFLRILKSFILGSIQSIDELLTFRELRERYVFIKTDNRANILEQSFIEIAIRLYYSILQWMIHGNSTA